jgi:hypothetical protein
MFMFYTLYSYMKCTCLLWQEIYWMLMLYTHFFPLGRGMSKVLLGLVWSMQTARSLSSAFSVLSVFLILRCETLLNPPALISTTSQACSKPNWLPSKISKLDHSIPLISKHTNICLVIIALSKKSMFRNTKESYMLTQNWWTWAPTLAIFEIFESCTSMF